MKDFDFFSNISDLIPSNKGGKKESIYKKSALDEMNGKSLKNKRDKIRKILFTFCSSVSSANDKNAKRIFVEFEKFINFIKKGILEFINIIFIYLSNNRIIIY